MGIIQKFKIWWRGEFISPTTEELFNHDKQREDKFKQPIIPKILTIIWRFWLRRWPIILPIIVGALVALFIHFDSKTTSNTTQQQKNPISNEIRH